MAIKNFSVFQGQNIKIPSFLILGLGGVLVAVYLTVNLRADKAAHLAMSLVFLCAACSNLWDKKTHLQLGTNAVSIAMGASLISGILYQGLRPPTGLFLGFAPLMSALGVMLLASGMQALSQYNAELLILFCLGVPKLLLKFLPDISPLTAQFSTYLLWYSGFSVRLSNNHIWLPEGGVNVVPSCSGLNLITYMLAITAIFLLMFPLPTTARILAPIVAISWVLLLMAYE